MRAALFLLCLPTAFFYTLAFSYIVHASLPVPGTSTCCKSRFQYFRFQLYGIVIHQNLRRRNHLSHALQFCLPVRPVETV